MASTLILRKKWLRRREVKWRYVAKKRKDRISCFRSLL